ncbi:MAG: amino acid racemase [Burkholderiaceae bacterium]|jgi:aspartate racemase|nr:amino acid racemase [Burkholderiaceae bacterium]
MLGVLGGMGPVATADFFTKLLALTPAQQDEDHLPVLLLSDPRIPRRPAAILDGGESPLPRLRALRDRLVDGGASFLAMPCNTAHHWYAPLAADCPVPFLSIVDASVAALSSRAAAGSTVALLATAATLAARVYDAPLAAAGYVLMPPSPDQQQTAVLPAIARVKAGDAVGAAALLEPVVRALQARGAAAVLLACTELPVALDAVGSPLRACCVDSSAALAQHCIAHWQAQRPRAA